MPRLGGSSNSGVFLSTLGLALYLQTQLGIWHRKDHILSWIAHSGAATHCALGLNSSSCRLVDIGCAALYDNIGETGGTRTLHAVDNGTFLSLRAACMMSHLYTIVRYHGELPSF